MHDPAEPGELFPLQPLATRSTPAMEAAFDTAWNSLCLSGLRLTGEQACDARTRMAQAICEKFRAGERDPLKLHDIAMASLEALIEQPRGDAESGRSSQERWHLRGSIG